MTLSIALITKNESKNLRQCLTALQPILDAVPSELIIADTGSADGTLAIAREFTDKVLQIEWTDDFAAARNHTVRAALGEWFMFMDADEFWEETGELIAFFNSGEHKEYNSASHILNDEYNGGIVKPGVVTRLFRLRPETRFVGRIHEHIPAELPMKHLKSHSRHTGYLYATEADEQAKRNRNRTLMRQVFEAEPDNLHNLLQFVKELEGEAEQAKFLEIGLSAVRQDKTSGHFHAFNRIAVRRAFVHGETEQAVKLADEYMKAAPETVTAIDIYHIRGEAQKKLGRVAEAAESYEEALRLLRLMDDGLLDMNPTVFDTPDCLKPDFAEGLIFNLILAYAEPERFDRLFYWCRFANPLQKGFMPFYLATIAMSGYLHEILNAKKMIESLHDSHPTEYVNFSKLFKVTINKPELREKFDAVLNPKPMATSSVKPLLSIGMITKNEELNLHRCLTALKPIQSAIPTELIIADTGSTDSTVEIAEQYTPHVLQIEWTDDFAAARNHTVRAATGEWYMFMDADEFWEDTAELTAFFKSGEYKKYNSASYQRINILPGGQQVQDTRAGLVKLEADTAFEGIIHESIPVKQPRKFLNSYAIHTGYNHATPAEAAKKKQRNMTLLAKAHEADKKNLHIISQLVHETTKEGADQTEHKRWLDMGFKVIENAPGRDQFHFFYHRMALFCLWEKQYEDCVKVAEKYFAQAKTTIAAIDIGGIKADALQNLGKLPESAAEYEKALALCKKHAAGKLDANPASFDMLKGVDPGFADYLRRRLLALYIELEDAGNLARIAAESDITKLEPEQQANILFLLLKNNRGFEEAFEQAVEAFDIDKAEKLAATMLTIRSDYDLAVTNYALTARGKKPPAAKPARWLMLLTAHTLEAEGLPPAQESAVYELFISAAQAYLSDLYRPEVLTDEGIMQLDAVSRFAYHAWQAEEALTAGDQLGFLQQIKSAVGQHQYLARAGLARIERYKESLA